MKFISDRFPIDFGEGKVTFVIKVVRLLKEELSEYYATIFSRKAGPPLCIALCLAAIVSYVIMHF